MLSRDVLIALNKKGKFPSQKVGCLLNSKQNTDAAARKILGVDKSSLSDLSGFESTLNRGLIDVVTRVDEAYPNRLRDFDDSPLAIYCKGDKSLLHSPLVVGIVGTRKATAYGLSQATALSGELSARGFVVVSGLALGVDSAAHKAALENRSKTIAVLGTPIDRIYPMQNEALARRIIDSGSLVISEYPPGMKTEKYHFIFRNRIIAALSDIVIIVEAPEHSGALATARYAMEYGKDVYVVPGDINKLSFLGSNRLIEQGAFVVSSVNDFLQCIGLDKKPTRDILKSDQLILDALVSCEGNFDRMLECLDEDAAKLNVDLMRLEIEGFVKKDIIGKYYLV
jgi:DNA processing protein